MYNNHIIPRFRSVSKSSKAVRPLLNGNFKNLMLNFHTHLTLAVSLTSSKSQNLTYVSQDPVTKVPFKEDIDQIHPWKQSQHSGNTILIKRCQSTAKYYLTFCYFKTLIIQKPLSLIYIYLLIIFK